MGTRAPLALVALASGGIAVSAAHGGPAWLVALALCVFATIARLRPAALATLAATAATVFFLGVAVLPQTGLYRTVTVLSGSMEPAFSPGDLIVVTPQPARDVAVGQVITYAIPVGDRQVESHRVVEVLSGGDRPVVRTKGDANAAADPWIAQLDGGVVWRQRLTVPYAGRAIVFLRDPLLRRVTVLLFPALLLALGLIRIWRPEPKEGASGAALAI